MRILPSKRGLALTATAAVVGLTALDALRSRSQVDALPTLTDGSPAEGSWSALSATGVDVSPEVRTAAATFAEANGLDLVDLVPAGLAATFASDLAHAPLAGAGVAIVVRSELLDRAGIEPGVLAAGELAAARRTLSGYTDHAGSAKADLEAPSRSLADRRDHLEGGNSSLARSAATSVAALVALVGSAIVAPLIGLLGLVAYAATGLLRGESPQSTLGRLLHAPLTWLEIRRLPQSAASIRRDEEVAEARAWYSAELDKGVERFLEPRQTECPWCTSAAIAPYLQSKDIRQAKPGLFTLDKCADCRHIFQNPRLTLDGLEFYYKDAYDGLAEAQADINFTYLSPIYRRRAETIRTERPDVPRRWLDIGTGGGHFCHIAHEVFPDTSFDGLDMSTGVLEGQRRGWLDTAYHGMLIDREDDIAGQYDQVSLYHYLEHTREPLAELDAAVKALSPDGWLLIEQPDPEAVVARLFRSWWAGWLQPEHLHMVNADNVCKALEDRGLEIVKVLRREAHMPVEGFILVTTLLRKVAPDPDLPWRTEKYPTLARIRRIAGLAVIGPLLIFVPLIDRVIIPKLLKSSHAYRILARRPQITA